MKQIYSSYHLKWVALCCILLCSATMKSQTVSNALAKVDKNFFIENKGQWHSDVLYLARMGGLDAWITKYGVNYTFYKLEEVQEFSPYRNQNREIPGKPDENKNYTLLGHRVLMQLENHNPAPMRTGKGQLEGYYNYFIGNDDRKHATYVGLYKEVLVKDVYNGIDVRYYYDKGNLRYDYVVRAGADIAQIRFTLTGSNKTYLNKQGNLVFNTRFGEIEMADLYVYQAKDKKPVNASFVKQGSNSWSFAVNNYDKTQDLIIDPLVYSTYLGGSADDGNWGWWWRDGDLAVDATDNAYVTGWTASANYDITAGTFQVTNGGGWDVFVTKLNNTGTALIYSTYIGGSGTDDGRGIAVDASGNAYITGYTESNNYDVTAGTVQTTYGGGTCDVFVTKLNSTGTALIFSTYIGGTGTDTGNGIAIDGVGSIYIAGATSSTDYDITPGVYQPTYAGGMYDVFITKLNSTGTALAYSTFIGGSDYDVDFGIAVDVARNAYITGGTASTNYDVTAGAFQTAYGGFYDAFVTKLNSTGTALVYSTYIGKANWDYAFDIAVDGSSNAYITGYTSSTNYDVTAGAFQTVLAGSNDVFVTKFNTTGTGLVYSTLIGGTGDDRGFGIAVDASNNAYVTGFTSSTDYDVTVGAFQTTNGGGSYDVLATQLNSTGSALLYSTYVGGTGADYSWDIALDNTGYAYITGYTQSTNYDVTAGAFQTTHGGGTNDVFVTKLGILPLPLNVLSFEGVPTTNAVQLKWVISASDKQNYFVLERSSSKNTLWKEIVTVPAQNTLDDIQNHYYTDTEPYSGTNYYRLKIVDKNGGIIYSDIIEVYFGGTTSNTFELYPNPNKGAFTLQSQNSENAVFELTDISGKVLNTYFMQNTNRMDIQIQLPTGMYLIRERQSGVIQKLIIE